MLVPHINVGANISISLKGLNEELRTPGKYQVRIETSTKEINLKDYGFVDIKSENHRFGAVSCDRELCLNNLSPSGSFVLDVTVTIKDLSASSTHYVLKNPLKVYKQIAMNNSDMLENPQFSDFKFVVKDKEFKVHRNILASASPIFARLFTADMDEARKSECTVKDIEPKIFEHLLQFIYGGKLPEDIGAVAVKLYEAAHYYEINQLKEICQQEFPSMLKTENALEMFNWACTYDEEYLKMEAWKKFKRQVK
jgi:BTB/POZ domain